MALDGAEDAGVGEPETLRPPPGHDEEALRARARHDAVEEPQRLRDEARAEVLLEGERALHERMRETQGVLALGDAQLAEVLARRPEVPHVVVGEEREARVRASGPVGVHRVARELAEVRDVVAERVDVVGVARDARDHARVAGLHRARGAAKGHHPAGSAEVDGVQPARRHSEVLHEADRVVGRQGEARYAHPVDIGLGEPGACEERRERPAEKPVGAADGVALVGNGHRRGDHDVAIGLPLCVAHDAIVAPEGKTAIRELLRAAPWRFSVRVYMNPLIEVHGETATGSWVTREVATLEASDRAVFLFAGLDDEHVRRNERWYKSRAAMTNRFMTPFEEPWTVRRNQPHTPQRAAPEGGRRLPLAVRGRRGRTNDATLPNRAQPKTRARGRGRGVNDTKAHGTLAVVTGAARGIGKGCAEALGAGGASSSSWSTCWSASSNPPKTDSRGQASRRGGFVADVADHRRALEVVAEVLERHAAIDVLVNNAGTPMPKGLLEIEEHEWDRTIDVHMKGCFNWCRAVAPSMLAGGAGRIINISSVSAHSGGVTRAVSKFAYAGAKAGILGMTRALAKELGPAVSVNAICPGAGRDRAHRLDARGAVGRVHRAASASAGSAPRRTSARWPRSSPPSSRTTSPGRRSPSTGSSGRSERSAGAFLAAIASGCRLRKRYPGAAAD